MSWKKIISLLKYILAAVIVVLGSSAGRNAWLCMFSGILELLVVLFVTEMLLERHPGIARVVNVLGILLLNIQYAVMYFGGTYVSMIMMTNIHALSALRGRGTSYIGAGVFVAAVSFMPVWRLSEDRVKPGVCFYLCLVGDVMLCSTVGSSISPYYSLSSLCYTGVKAAETKRSIAAAAEAADVSEETPAAVENESSPSPETQPDVVVFFTEGMSQNFVEDSRDFMPNIRQYEQSSINFVNYFNHTSATYRGIPGQLHSGFQFEDMDDNGLSSLQSVFSTYGYETILINPEPYKEDFAQHLGDMGFDRYVNDSSLCDLDYISDKKMYETAYDLLDEQSDKPRLIVLYTYGTHVAMESPDEVFTTGESNLLNKFYNLDYQFGMFMQKIETGPHADHTVVVFTADHAAYEDDDFRKTFTGDTAYERTHNFCDRIPFFIWKQGLEAEEIDADGRTSLDMAPTVLDYMNMTIPSDFEGTSLFNSVSGEQRVLETTYGVPVSDEYVSTDGGYIHDLSEEERSYVENEVMQYCAKAQAAYRRNSE